MESRISRKSRFQIERLEGRDIPSHLPCLIGLLAASAEGPSPDRSGYEVQAVRQPLEFQKIAPKAIGANIIAIVKR
jgi:hypothetical protein